MKGVLEGIRVPEFELSHNSLDQSRILAVMYFPNDESLRRAYYSVCLAEHELTEAKEDREMAVSADLLEDLISAPSQQDLLRQSRKQGKRGMIAGDVLLAVYAMYSFPKYFPEPSIRSAIFVAQRFAKETKFEDKTKLPSSEKAIRDHFYEFRTVAHFWAAFRLQEVYPNRPDEDMLSSADAVQDFLGSAGTLQDFGCSFVPKRTRHQRPILDPDSIWSVSEAFPRWHPPWKEPPEWLVEAIRNYSA